MPTPHAIAIATAGLLLSAGAVSVAAPATAATTPCTDLVGCANSTLTGTTGALTTTVTGTLHTVTTTTLPTVLTLVPATLTSLLSPLPVSPPPKPPVPPGHGSGHGHGHSGTPAVVGPTQHRTTHSARASTHSIASTTTTGVSLLGTQPTDHDRLVWPVVAATVQKLLTLVGWNLLALLPMAGIAFAISRRMASFPRVRVLRGR